VLTDCPRVLVTGAAGFVGSHLCEALLAVGCRVTGIDCFTDYYDPGRKRANLAVALQHPRFTLLEADLLLADLVGLLGEIDEVYHLAGQPGVRGSWGQQFEVYTCNNILATQRLLEANLAVGGRPLVYASSSSVYGNLREMPLRENMALAPVSPYGVTKLAAEYLCRLYHDVHGVPTVSLRLFTVYGPRQRPDMAFGRFLMALSEGREISVYGDGCQTRDFTYVADVVHAFQMAMAYCHAHRNGPDGQERVFNVAGGSRVSVLQVLALAAQITGCELRLRNLPAQPGDVRDTWADTTRACDGLGFTAETDLRKGMAAEWRWLSHA
jgi:nucleoside-diphosphate-sugar epimerase